MLPCWAASESLRETLNPMNSKTIPSELDRQFVASCIEHTALKPETTRADIERLCHEAKDHKFGAVCIAPVWIPMAKDLLWGSDVRIATVNGFPHGNTLPSAKASEARDAVRAGADDIDMVMQIGRLIDGDFDFARDDIRAVVEAARPEGVRNLKVILEVGYLSDHQIERACQIAEEAGADFVKTSTGFGVKEEKEKIEYVRLMKSAVGDRLGVKAAGGVGDLETAILVIKAGATRIGSSRSLEIMK